jgi:hypothetical protein
MLLITATATFSQQSTPSPTLTKQDYLKKSKRQKTTAFLLLPVGVLSTGLGMIRFKNEDGTYGNSMNTVFLVSGLAAIAGSITLFIASSRNKNKGMGLSFKNETVPQLENMCSTIRSVPTVTLKIDL